MSYSVLQSASAVAGSGNGVATFGTNLTSGSKIICVFSVSVSTGGVDGLTSATLNDTAVTALTKLVSVNNAANSGWLYLLAVDTPSDAVGTKPTVTVNWNSGTFANFGNAILIQEVSGLLPGNTSAMLDGTPGTNNGNSTGPATTGAYSSTATNEYLCAIYGDPGDGVTVANSSGYTPDANNPTISNNANIFFDYKNSGHTTESASWTLGGSAHWNTILGAFQLGSPPIVITPSTLPSVLGIGQTYSFALSVSGGSGSGYTWSVSSGSLPSGLSLTGSGSTDTISGTITGSPASSTFTIQVTDGASNTGTQTYTINTITVPAATSPTFSAIPGFAVIGADTPGDPGPAPSGPSSGPVFYPANQAIRARKPLQPRAGRIYSMPGGPLRNPASGPVFHQATSPARARIPRGPTAGCVTGYGSNGAICGAINGNAFGSANGSKGAPLKNPAAGPVFKQRTTPVRFIIPPPTPRGRIGTSFTKVVQIPVHGPPLYPLQGPVRAKAQPRAGLNYSSLIEQPVKGSAYTLFSQGAAGLPHALGSSGDTGAFTLGVQFSVSQPIALTGVWFYSGSDLSAGATLPTETAIYDISGSSLVPGTHKTSVSWSGAALSGWVKVTYDGTVTLQPGHNYVAVVYSATQGGNVWFDDATGYWTAAGGQGGQSGLTSGPLSAPNSTGAVNGQAVFNSGTGIAFPATSVSGFDFGVDVEVSTPSTSPVFASQYSTGRIRASYGAPVQNPAAGPVFTQKTSPARARITLAPRGRVYVSVIAAKIATPAAVVFPQRNTALRAQIPPRPRGRMASIWGMLQDPAAGPVFTQKTSPVQARQPLPRKGRIAFNKGAVSNPVTGSGPVFLQKTSPARIRPSLPIRGRISFHAGAPVKNPASGPVFRQATSPARIRPSLPPRGRIESNPGSPLHNLAQGPVFVQKPYPARSRITPPPRGRISFNKGAVRNPASGPVFLQKTSPARIRPVLPPRGIIGSNPGGPVRNPVPPTQPSLNQPVGVRVVFLATGRASFNKGAVSNPVAPVGIGPVFRQRTSPAMATGIILPRRGICRTIKFGPVATNPGPGPVFIQAVRPVQARFPLPARGRVYSNPGGPLRNPGPTGPGPVFVQRSFIRAQLPLPRRGVCRSIKFYPMQSQPVQSAAFLSRTTPVQARFPLPPKGRISSNKGAPLGNLSPGPVFRPATFPIRIRITLPPRGRTASNPGGPVSNPVTSIGPVFIQKPYPARIRPSLPSRGRVIFNKGTLRNPGSGPVFRQAVHPAQARIPQVFSKGRVYSNPGGPLSNPPEQLAPLYPLQRPVQAKFPLPRRGRIASNPGTLPPPPEHVAPLYPLAGPIRIRVTLPPRGRISSNKGAPLSNPVQAKVYPLQSPVRARQPLPPHGRVILGNKGAPVHNPASGPVFRQAVHPIRAIIPQNAPRGRTGGNYGGPVLNPSGDRAAVWNSGQTYTRWTAGSPYSRWQLGQPYTRESTGEG